MSNASALRDVACTERVMFAALEGANYCDGVEDRTIKV